LYLAGPDNQGSKKNIRDAISLYLEPDEDILPGKGARVIEVAV